MPHSRLRSPLLHRRSTWLAAGALLLAASGTAPAQGLRGQVAESQVTRDLLWRSGLEPTPERPPEQRLAAPAYMQVPSGATENEEVEAPNALQSLFPDPPTDADALGEPRPASRSSGLRRREQQAETTKAEPVVERAEPTGANPRTKKLDADDEERNDRIETGNERTAAIETPDFKPEEDPFAPLGLRLGTFNAITTFEQGLSYTSNATFSPVPESAVLSETTLRLDMTSDWSRHSAAVNAYGTYRKSIDGAEVTDPNARVDARLDLDFSDSLRGLGSLGYALRREDASSPVDFPATVTSRPIRQDIMGSAGLEVDFGRLRFAATGNLLRQQFGDAELAGGGVLSQEDRNSTLLSGILRSGYEISPALTPFVEVEYGRRFHDERLDRSGYDRSSDRVAARLGADIDLGEKLSGGFAVGYVTERFDDARLPEIAGASVRADMTWSPERGTFVNLDASSEVEGTTTAGESGSILYTGTLSLERRLRANLTGAALVGLSWRDYAASPNRDLTWRGETGLTWWINRYAGVTSRYRYERLESTLPDRDAEAHTGFLGVTFRR